MKKSFQAWCDSRLKRAQVYYSKEDVAFFDEHLRELLDYGCADLFQLSDFLETLPFENAQDGGDARRIFLSNLDSLGLPSFLGLLERKGRRKKSFHSYIGDAKSFFRYDAYMEASKRKKALKAIEDFSEKNTTLLKENGFFTEEKRGPAFGTDVKFVEALKSYVETEDNTARKGLLQSDFVAISDEILKFKPIRKRRRKETVSKVAGSPIEAVLTALWLSLKDYKNEDETSSFPCKVSFLGKLFKYHDIAEDSSTTAASQEKASGYIKRLLGGVDALVEEHLLLDCGGPEPCEVTSELLSEDLEFGAAKNAEPYFAFQVCLFSEEDEESWEYNFAWRLPESNSFRIAQELLDWALHSLKTKKEMVDMLPVYHLPYYEELLLAKDDEETRQVLLYALRDRSAGVTDLLTSAWRSNRDPMLKPMERLAHAYCLCIKKAAQEGLFSICQKPAGERTLGSQKTPWQDVRDCYQEAGVDF
ncbi:MAG TPA: hypothetical protein PLW97_13460, partial [Synergistaceae bacterium]|nr:hypothetical protein [Synergistaceae bacterium]